MNSLTMPPRVRKWALTAHITFSVGWVGAVAGFLALSIAGVTSQNPEVVRAAYVGMNLIGWFIIVPCSLAALLSGIVQSLGTEWGLFRHYWLLVKFVFTIVATLLLLLHQFTAVAGAARRVSETAPGTLPDAGRFGIQLVGDAGLGLMVLLVITTLSVLKPWGRIRYSETASGKLPLGLKILLAITVVIVVVFRFVVHHGGMHGAH
jgi:hypothetical protein